MSTLHQTIIIRRDLAERCAGAMARKNVTFNELIDAALEDALENLDELVFRSPPHAVQLMTAKQVREDLVLKLRAFSGLKGVAFAPDALKRYRMDCPGTTRQQILQEVETLASGRTSFKKRIGDKTAHIVPLTANRATPAQELTFLHYIRAEENNGEGKFILSTERGDAPEEHQPERPTSVYEALPTITYEAPSVLSYGDE